MTDLVGRTIARVEDRGDVIHFTDGTALRITSDDGHYIELLDRGAVRAKVRKAQGARERNRLQRLQRLEWLSVSCEERGRRRAEREAKMSPFELAIRRDFGNYRGSLLTPTHEKLCSTCGDPDCENTEVVPATIDFGSMTITIPKVSQKRKARRS